MTVLKIVVPGTPVPKPRQTRADKWKKRPCVMRYRAWADLARIKAKEAGGLPVPDSISRITCRAYFQPPESWSKKKIAAAMGQMHRVMPDASNVQKAVEDSLFERDEALADVRTIKLWDAVPRVEIEIEYEVTRS